MRVFGLWHGGSSYAEPWIDTELETFDSLTAAGNEFWERGHRGNGDFAYVSKPLEYMTETPDADADAWLKIYFRDPRDERDPYPDRIIRFGPRGGVKIERC